MHIKKNLQNYSQNNLRKIYIFFERFYFFRFLLWLNFTRKSIFFIITSTLLLVLPGLIISGTSRIFIDYYLIEKRNHWIGIIILIFIAVAVFQTIVLSLQKDILLRFETRLSFVKSSEFLNQILKLPMEFFNKHYGGNIASYLELNDQIANLLSQGVSIGIFNLLISLVFALCLFIYSPILGIGCISISLIVCFFYLRFNSFLFNLNKDLSLSSTLYSGLISNFLHILEAIKSTNNQEKVYSKIFSNIAKIINKEQEIEFYQALFNSIYLASTLVSTMLILALGGWSVKQGVWTIGDLVAFQALAVSFSSPIAEFFQQVAKVHQIIASFSRFCEIRKFSNPPTNLKSENNIISKGSISINNLEFGYCKRSEPIIRNIQLEIFAGQKIAFVGATGSGKSTLAQLIARLYTPWKGSILIDDHFIQNISQKDFTRSLAMIHQENQLFSGTIYDNLILGYDKPKKERIYQALQDVELEDLISLRGLHGAIVERGKNLSGGQCQKLQIAKVFIHQPKVLILDEATSALDTVSEQKILKKIWEKPWTCLIISHRLNAIKDSDQIIVLDKGEIRETGTHLSLLRHNGIYSSLVASEKLRENF